MGLCLFLIDPTPLSFVGCNLKNYLVDNLNLTILRGESRDILERNIEPRGKHFEFECIYLVTQVVV